MSRWAPVVLAVFAACLFLLIMGDADGPFLGIATQMVFLYGLVRLWLAKYRRPIRVPSFVGVTALLVAIVCGALFYKQFLEMSPQAGGRILFGAALIDIIIEYLGKHRVGAE